MERLDKKILFNTDVLSQDLAQKTIRGGMWTLGAQGIQFILQMIGTMVLARLLTPVDYGLIGMVVVVVNFANMFKDAGLSTATVQKKIISHEQISTLFWINVLVSIFLSLCLLGSAPLVARFYGKSELTAITAVLSISFFLSGLSIQHAALLQRHMRFGGLAFAQIAAQVITLAMTIFLALAGWRYWALVCGILTNALVSTVLTFYYCPWVPGRMQRGTGIGDALKFGGNLTCFNFINYFSRNLDNILIGKYLGVTALGIYSRAYQLFMLPIYQIRGPIINVALPVLSSLKEQPERYINYFRRLLNIMATLIFPLTMYCIIEANFLIDLILGKQWLEVIPIFRFLAVAGLIQAIASTRGLVLLSFGYSSRYLIWGMVNAFFTIIAFVVGLKFGIKGIAISYVLVTYVILIPSLFYCYQKTPVTVSLFLKSLLMPFLISSVSILIILILKWTRQNESALLHFVYFGVFTAIYTGISYCRKENRILTGLFLKCVFGDAKNEVGADL